MKILLLLRIISFVFTLLIIGQGSPSKKFIKKDAVGAHNKAGFNFEHMLSSREILKIEISFVVADYFFCLYSSRDLIIGWRSIKEMTSGGGNKDELTPDAPTTVQN